MIKRILLLFLLMELGVIGWFFNQSHRVEEDMTHGQPIEFQEETNDEPVATSQLIEQAKQLLALTPDVLHELHQFGQVQDEVIDSNLLQELDQLQLETGSSLDLNDQGFQEVLQELLEDPSNNEKIEVFYHWLKDRVAENEEKILEVINNEDSFHEKRVLE
ncbi:hypothetical protein [Bacillus pinisoli]|uniref:hypothetical protein n=1 Tax=Bacillus pinisoli TaxID=2901866 RepID=UPI001FF60A5E|nr:hypothetical protein [Bacillus pinisoli]